MTGWPGMRKTTSSDMRERTFSISPALVAAIQVATRFRISCSSFCMDMMPKAILPLRPSQRGNSRKVSMSRAVPTILRKTKKKAISWADEGVRTPRGRVECLVSDVGFAPCSRDRRKAHGLHRLPRGHTAYWLKAASVARWEGLPLALSITHLLEQYFTPLWSGPCLGIGSVGYGL